MCLAISLVVADSRHDSPWYIALPVVQAAIAVGLLALPTAAYLIGRWSGVPVAVAGGEDRDWQTDCERALQGEPVRFVGR